MWALTLRRGRRCPAVRWGPGLEEGSRPMNNVPIVWRQKAVVPHLGVGTVCRMWVQRPHLASGVSFPGGGPGQGCAHFDR